MQSQSPNDRRADKPDSLFEPIEPEWIEMEAAEGQTQKYLDLSSKEIVIIVSVFLLFLISNGEITLPLIIVIPEILINISEAPLWLVIPCIVSVCGVFMMLFKFNKKQKSRSDYRVIYFGLMVILIAMYMFLHISENLFFTFISFFMFIGVFLALLKLRDATNKVDKNGL